MACRPCQDRGERRHCRQPQDLHPGPAAVFVGEVVQPGGVGAGATTPVPTASRLYGPCAAKHAALHHPLAEHAMPEIDANRLLQDLYAVREIGKYKTGVHRPTFSPLDVEARHWLAGRPTGGRLGSSIYGIGNVYGRDPAPGRKLLMGSHIETQNRAGWLD